MKQSIYTALLLTLTQTALAQQPFNQDPGNPNLDFSSGNFTHWQLSHGERGMPYDSSGAMTAANSHTIVSIYGNNWDGNTGPGGLKRVPDGLAEVARLGAPAGGGYGSPKSYAMKYHITVSPGYPVLFFRIASVMDKTHSNSSNTHYKFSIRNASGNYLLSRPCSGIELTPRGTIVSGSNIITDPLIPYNSIPEVGAIVYQPWQSVAVDLSGYAGQQVIIEYEHNDCYLGHHGSYTYISAAMRSPYDTFYICRGVAETTIKPYQPDFASYLWNTGDTTENLVIRNPVGGTVYTCTVSSYNGCTATFTYVLKETGITPDFTTAGGNACNQIQFYNAATTDKGHIISWHWTFGDPASGVANTDTAPDPVHIYPAPGDYTVTLTATDTNGCSNTVSRIISVSPDAITARFRLPDTTCIFDTLSFEDLTAGVSRRIWIADGITLEDTAAGIRRAFSQAGRHTITLITIAGNGCPDSLTHTFEVHPLPVAGIEIDPATASAPIGNPMFTFRGLESGASAYLWRFGYGDATGTGEHIKFIYPSGVAEYIVTLTTYNQYGCFDTASATVSLLPADLYIPSAFTPNGDGKNDVFRIVNMTSRRLLNFSIYNRYGQKVFYGTGPGDGWDGTLGGRSCETGVYYYIVNIVYPDGTQKEIKSDVTLIR